MLCTGRNKDSLQDEHGSAEVGCKLVRQSRQRTLGQKEARMDARNVSKHDRNNPHGNTVINCHSVTVGSSFAAGTWPDRTTVAGFGYFIREADKVVGCHGIPT